MEAPFKLRCELRGHTEDVRSLCVADIGLLTGSRDKTIKLWKEQEGLLELALDSTYLGHMDFVSALAFLAPGAAPAFPSGAVVSGSRDANVVVWDDATATPLLTLEGHKYQVAAVVTSPQGDIYSASLDKTIRQWREGQCVGVLEAHKAAVLCLLLLPNGDLVSGSGDCTVRVWSGGRCTHTIPAHGDSVRGLALLPNMGVISASHDQTLKVWTFGGECISELVGHAALVYCVAATEEGLIASGSEDNTLKLWHADGTCLQTIPHPGNLWAVAFLPNGDLVSACSDGVARVWSRHPARQAPEEVQQAYEQVLQALKEAAAAPSAEGVAGGGLPGGIIPRDPSALLNPGTNDGQNIVVMEDGIGVAYSWDATRGEWERIGEVVGGHGGVDTMAAGSKWHDGKMWDYVFDVDAEEGAPPRKLALNRGDNPYDVADKWLERENLPASYREQIVQFILQNTQGTELMPPPPSYNPDPYTGGAAYVPPGPSSSASQAGQSSFVDPFTGAGAYVPPPTGSSGGAGGGAGASGYSVTGGGADPFTGSATATHHIPARAYLLYDAVPPTEAIRRKILELSQQLGADTGSSSLALGEAVVAAGGPLDSLLSSASRPPSRSGKYSEDDGQALVLLSRLLSWPAPALFPALDLARLATLDAAAAATLAASGGALSADSPPGSLGRALAVAASQEPSPLPANQQTALRLVCNCFAHQPLLLWLQPQGGALLDAFAPCAVAPSKNVRQGLATLLLNLAVLLGKIPAEELEFKARILGLALELLNATPAEDPETRFRGLLAVGTLARESGRVRGMCRDLGYLQVVRELKGVPGKVGEVAVEMERLLRL